MVTADDKQTFLALVRSGQDPSVAAPTVNPDYRGSTFRRLTNEGNINYDAEFAADYLRARAEGRANRANREPSAKPRPTTLSGHVKAAYLTEEMLEHFLEEVANGTPLKKAADSLEPKTTLTQINRRAHRDSLFAEAYAQAKEQGYPVFQENLRALAYQQAQNGNYAATRDHLIVHVPEYREALLTRKHEFSGGLTSDVRVLVEQVFPGLPPKVIEELIKFEEQKLIESGDE